MLDRRDFVRSGALWLLGAAIVEPPTRKLFAFPVNPARQHWFTLTITHMEGKRFKTTMEDDGGPVRHAFAFSGPDGRCVVKPADVKWVDGRGPLSAWEQDRDLSAWTVKSGPFGA